MDEHNDGLRDLRTGAKWSIRRVELALGLPHGWLSQIERGERPLPARLVARIAALYSDPDRLVTADAVLAAADCTRALVAKAREGAKAPRDPSEPAKAAGGGQ
ncbi:MAG: helix-turn-helix domain-containing protein [Steroidobacteraceae bacterium]